MDISNTIAAISTPFGKGGVALLRVSGSDSIDISEKVFVPRSGKKLSECRSRVAVFGDILYDGRIIDDGIAVVYRAPSSYTGEDTVEISCHGGIKLSQNVLESLLCAGAVCAEPGEFTKRAFLNGKLSLSQAEAVMGLIDAGTDEQIKLAASHRKGVLTRKADEIYDRILSLISSTYAYIDYPDEDLTDISVGELVSETDSLCIQLDALERSYNTGKAVSEGIKTVIIGKPNTGKSSLLNAMLGERRAIVTDIAGTTRDTIESDIKLDRIILKLVDTAGIRETEDTVEKLGVELAFSEAEKAELILAVFDISRPLDREDDKVIKYLKEKRDASKKTIVILNKSDISENKKIPEEISGISENIIIISTGDEGDIKKLKALIEGMFIEGEIDYDSTCVLDNARQLSAVKRCHAALCNALDSLKSGFTQDVAGIDLEEALKAIGELDSRSVGIDIVDRIFSRFCVGK